MPFWQNLFYLNWGTALPIWNDGKQAVEAVLKNGPYDLIFMDLPYAGSGWV